MKIKNINWEISMEDAYRRLDEMTAERAAKAIGVPARIYVNMTTSERHNFAYEAFRHCHSSLEEFMGLPKEVDIDTNGWQDGWDDEDVTDCLYDKYEFCPRSWHYENNPPAPHGFDLILIEKPGMEGLTQNDAVHIFNLLNCSEGFPIEIGEINGNSSAMGFISPTAAEKLQYEYDQTSKIGQYLSDILGDIDKEHEDCIYQYNSIRILMTRDIYSLPQ